METKAFITKISKLVLTAIIVALIVLAIFLIRIPIPFTQGYLNLCDGVIFIGVMILGRRNGALAAAVGTMLGDILGGFAMWAPWSFFINGGMALIMALILSAFTHDNMSEAARWVTRIVAMAVGGLFMVFGYFIAEGLMYGNWAIAVLGIPWNIGQFAIGIVLACMVAAALIKAQVMKKDGTI
ncbi:MAG: ECF transporter S component [Eubacteriales bacterium]|nr:ECF transporter S component [Eubacteriales bacterium]